MCKFCILTAAARCCLCRMSWPMAPPHEAVYTVPHLACFQVFLCSDGGSCGQTPGHSMQSPSAQCRPAAQSAGTGKLAPSTRHISRHDTGCSAVRGPDGHAACRRRRARPRCANQTSVWRLGAPEALECILVELAVLPAGRARRVRERGQQRAREPGRRRRAQRRRARRKRHLVQRSKEVERRVGAAGAGLGHAAQQRARQLGALRGRGPLGGSLDQWRGGQASASSGDRISHAAGRGSTARPARDRRGVAGAGAPLALRRPRPQARARRRPPRRAPGSARREPRGRRGAPPPATAPRASAPAARAARRAAQPRPRPPRRACPGLPRRRSNIRGAARGAGARGTCAGRTTRPDGLGAGALARAHALEGTPSAHCTP